MDHAKPDAAFARAALDAVAADRGRLADRFTAETWWCAPAQALAVAALIASPAAGLGFPMAVISALATIALLGITRLFQRRSGISTNRPAGPLSLAVLIVLGVCIAALVVVAIVAEFVDALAWADGSRVWILVATAVGFLVALGGVVAYDHAYATDLRRAR